MNNFYIFIIRVIFGAVFAVILSRFFHPEMNILFVAGLGMVLVGMAYIFEYFRNKKKNPGKP